MNKQEWKRKNNDDLTIDNRKHACMISAHLKTDNPNVTVIVVHSSSRYPDGDKAIEVARLADQIAERMNAPSQLAIPDNVKTDSERLCSWLERRNNQSPYGNLFNEIVAHIRWLRGQVASKPVATLRVDCAGYGVYLSTYVAYALPEGMHDVYVRPQPAIPEGWQLVPKEPTQEMREAFVEAFQRGTLAYAASAMLAAAPQPTGSAK